MKLLPHWISTPNKNAAFRVHLRTRPPAELSLKKGSPYCSLGLASGQRLHSRPVRQRQACNPPGLWHVQRKIEINHKSYFWVWKKTEGNIFPGRRFRFHSWEHWCDQSQGIENIMRWEAGAGSLYSPNLLSCQLNDVNVSEFPSAPFSMRDLFFHLASAFLPDLILQARWPF